MKINLLGAGRVGSFVALKLLEEGFDIFAYDISEEALNFLSNKGIKTVKFDAGKEEELLKAIKRGDLIINALPGSIGFKILNIVIEEKKPIIDISFMPENPLILNEKAKLNNITAIVDIGIAPGLSHFLIGREYFINKDLKGAKIYVGGIPTERTFPFQYKAPFSPFDVLEEYTRKVRYRFNGILEEADPLTDIQEIYFPGIGTLEAFLTDGLRSLLQTTEIPTLIEKTLRYPGHCQAIKILKETGLLNKEPIDYKGNPVIPIEFLSKLLFPLWELKKDDKELTILLIFLWTIEKEINYVLFETTDEENGITSMAKTTGVPAIIMAKLFLEGKIKMKGILPPETLGMDEEIFKNFMEDFEKKGIFLKKQEVKK